MKVAQLINKSELNFNLIYSDLQNKSYRNLYIKNKFNNKLWRSILKKIILKMDSNNMGIQVISPFGFEVTNDRFFLNKNLRRFYCYIGVPKNNNVCEKNLCDIFQSKLLKVLHENYNDFYKNIVLKIIQNDFVKLKEESHICSESDKLIDIQFRYFDISLLDDYADILFLLFLQF